MLGGIVFGLVTPTETAALAVVIAGITGVVGGILMVVSAMSGVSYLKLAWAIMPLFLVLVVMLFVLVLFPEITLYIPRQAGFIQ